MPLPDDKRTEWLYAHFQAITRLSDRYLALFGVLVVSATALWLTSDGQIELAFIKVAADRQVLLGFVLIAALFTFVAFCGNFDYGEFTLKELASQLECDYEDLWLVDTHPTIVDFAKFRRPETAAKRGFIARLAVAMLHPVILLSALAWLAFIWGYETVVRDMTGLQAAP